MEPLIYESKYWIRQEDAPKQFDRTDRTIRQWVKDGKVRKMQPQAQVWLYRPDLEECEKRSRNRRRPS